MRRLLRALLGKPRSVYDNLSLNPSEIQQENYKNYLGGGAGQWDKRGAFQLHLLRALGLQPHHRLLDVGCGPLRGGVHFISFLETAHYHGADYNASFIEAARRQITELGLEAKEPTVEVVHDFQFSTKEHFDFVLAFSVLNHCSAEQQKTFLKVVPPLLQPGGRICLTHAKWCKPSDLAEQSLTTRSFRKLSDLIPGEYLVDWGWPDESEIFPILEITR